MWLIIFLLVLSFLIFKYFRWSKYWKTRGVSAPLTPWPLLGNFGMSILGQRSMALLVQDLYKAFPNKRYVGIYRATIPSLLILDPELIKLILVKEFDTFKERRTIVPQDVDPLWNKNLFAMKGGKDWHKMRSTLSPSFTSSKMKLMFNLMKDCSDKFSSHFLKACDGKTIEVEFKDAFGRYANDVIATTAFGVECDSLKNPKNEFFVNGESLGIFTSPLQIIKIVLYIFCPKIMQLFRVKMFSKNIRAFFQNVIKDTVKLREEKSIVRPDMIHLLMEARKGRSSKEEKVVDEGYAVVQEYQLAETKPHEITDDDIVAQALVFYFAGFDSSSTAMSHAVYELAINQDVQSKLREEVDQTLTQHNGEVTYEGILSMKYLDMVVSETLRKWPGFPFSDRKATKPFVIQPKDDSEQPLSLDVGLICTIPVYALHRDPKYYPNPEKFDPERFSEENKHKINPYTYLPFGGGPRNCIGSRFALLETKLIITNLISKFEIVPVKKTKIPLVLSKRKVLLVPDEGFWLGLKPRNK